MSKKAAEHHRKASEHLTRAARHHDEAAKHYDEMELAALVLWIATVNVFNRVNVATRQVPGEWAHRGPE